MVEAVRLIRSYTTAKYNKISQIKIIVAHFYFFVIEQEIANSLVDSLYDLKQSLCEIIMQIIFAVFVRGRCGSKLYFPRAQQASC